MDCASGLYIRCEKATSLWINSLACYIKMWLITTMPSGGHTFKIWKISSLPMGFPAGSKLHKLTETNTCVTRSLRLEGLWEDHFFLLHRPISRSAILGRIVLVLAWLRWCINTHHTIQFLTKHTWGQTWEKVIQHLFQDQAIWSASLSMEQRKTVPCK